MSVDEIFADDVPRECAVTPHFVDQPQHSYVVGARIGRQRAVIELIEFPQNACDVIGAAQYPYFFDRLKDEMNVGAAEVLDPSKGFRCRIHFRADELLRFNPQMSKCSENSTADQLMRIMGGAEGDSSRTSEPVNTKPV